MDYFDIYEPEPEYEQCPYCGGDMFNGECMDNGCTDEDNVLYNEFDEDYYKDYPEFYEGGPEIYGDYNEEW